ncbi:protein of unknown function (DU1801) [Cohaesibacter sp. ES.047]|uniref:DUF1801 domain-containing protein n=1 Tax=Cohaesibacter sp. ES.047 TaxID=1798205 RepID=UPI000BB6F9A6|nr:DUF1801 domain-containing protein [Cohaesibacter sp. ES.047]SNY90160.1 protein of unknown function (DU1801) [Cohaesibacter sp. ES.047]
MTQSLDKMSKDVEAAFAAFPDPARMALLTVRRWIHEIAGARSDVGAIHEEVKWGQPSFATRPKTGCPIRLGMPKDGRSAALYVPCQSKLIAQLREHYDASPPANWQFEGKRAIHFDPTKPLPETELRHAITLGLTYYSAKRD